MLLIKKIISKRWQEEGTFLLPLNLLFGLHTREMEREDFLEAS